MRVPRDARGYKGTRRLKNSETAAVTEFCRSTFGQGWVRARVRVKVKVRDRVRIRVCVSVSVSVSVWVRIRGLWQDQG